jgi:enoyl-CoA hydratase/carnithine racemase
MTVASVQVEVAGAIATIVIENAGKRNAVDADMWARFEPVLAELAEDDRVRVVVLRGAGEDFSAGADIGDLDRILPESPGSSGSPESAGSRGAPDSPPSFNVGSASGGIMSAAENALAAFAKPTIAAIDGFCVGGGWELAGACDIRIASERSTFGITPSRLGIIYPVSGIERVVALVGPAVAKHLLFTGELFPADAALGFGLVTKVLPVAGFWDAIAAFAELLASRSQYSIRAMKDIIDAIVGDRGDAERIAATWESTASDDRAIGVEAFLAKEKPTFRWPTSP